ncbi:MAG: hypothetical protein ABEJ36_03445 [Candidatus Nanosalina sp.]
MKPVELAAELFREHIWSTGVRERLLEFIYAPLNNPELVPNLLPLIMGAFIMELYFGKHKKEDLGWNTALGNAVIWMSTGISLIIAEQLSTPELYAAYVLIGVGFFAGFMDFFHIWPTTIGWVVSSSAVVYTFGWTVVMVIKTGVPVNRTTLISAGLFFVGINTLFKIIQGLETDVDSYSTGL